MPRPAYHHNPNEIIRLALCHAIDDRVSMIHAQWEPISKTYHDPEYVEECKLELRDFRLMLKRRYHTSY